MRSRTSLFALLFIAGSLALPHLAHASIPFFGPIIPGGNNVCPAGWGMLMTVVNNIIELLLTLAIVFVAPIMLAYAGFLYVVNPFNPSGISKAKSILINTIVGIVIALAGWMIVDAIMAVLYNPGNAGGAWSSLITSSGPACLPQKGALPQDLLDPTKVTPGVSATTTGGTLSSGTGACDAAVLQQLAPSLTVNQVNTFACLAKPESACGATMQNYSWNVGNKDGLASTAYGAFQVTLSTNHSCFDNQACYAAAGVAGPLNCQKGFGPKGFTAGGDPAVLANCLKAASNLACNFTAAICVQQKQGFSAWTADSKKAAQQACITQYAN